MNKSTVGLACLLSLSFYTVLINVEAHDHNAREHNLAPTDVSINENKQSHDDESELTAHDGSATNDKEGDDQSLGFRLKKIRNDSKWKLNRPEKKNMMKKEKMKCSMMGKKKADMDERFHYVWKAIMTMGEEIKKLQGSNTESHFQLDCPPESVNEAKCKMDENSQLCSGHGVCSCGVCICNPKHHGMFCECEPCEYHNGVQCGGLERGKCLCGKCDCLSQYVGNNCECDTNNTDTSACQDRNFKRLICSGNGDCFCNTCHCHEGFYGNLCQESVSPTYDCEVLKHCVRCQLFYPKDPGCFLCDFEITEVDKLTVDENQYLCNGGGESENCHLNFAYSLPDDNLQRVQVKVEKMKCHLNIFG